MVMAERMKREIAELRKNLYDLEAKLKGLVGVSKLSKLDFDFANKLTKTDILGYTMIGIGNGKQYIPIANPELDISELHILEKDGDNIIDIMSLSGNEVRMYRPLISSDITIGIIRWKDTSAYLQYDNVNKNLILVDGDIQKVIPKHKIREHFTYNLLSLNYDGVIPYFAYTNSTSETYLSQTRTNKNSIKNSICNIYEEYRILTAKVYFIGGTNSVSEYLHVRVRKEIAGDILGEVRTNQTYNGYVHEIDITQDFQLGDESNYIITFFVENGVGYGIILNAWIDVRIEVVEYD